MADQLLARDAHLLEHLARLTGMHQELLALWVRFFVALHDLGKFASAFQQLRRDLAPARGKKYFYTTHHDTLGHLLWSHRLADQLDGEGWWTPQGPEDADYLPDWLDQWMQAVTGHHGQPPKTAHDSLHRHFSDEDEQAALEYVRAAACLLLASGGESSPLPAKSLYARVRPSSWWLAGLTVLADWLGSNRSFFPFQTDPMQLDRYWHEIAMPNAQRALESAGLMPTAVAGVLSFHDLFDGITTPSPLQTECLALALPGGSQLFLVEDMTGAGKTEAAFILLNRLLANGDAAGAYLALPTMATANAMYRRTSRIYRRLFDMTSGPPSLVLAHGSRNLNDGYRESVLPAAPDGGEYDHGDVDAAARCNAWLAENSKRALLAQMGVGTIDQALLAVLTSRHQSLRLLGLSGKVLVVDEVHASDAYMHRLLCELLRLHAAAGGSAILLSATLPRKMRDELVSAFCSGTGRPAPALPETSYPLLTHVHGDSAPQLPVATREDTGRELEFRLLADEGEALKWIQSRVDAGRCVAWIRNSVADAIAARDALAESLGNDRVVVFHARFAMGDRLEIEEAILDTFGPASGSASRGGRVVVATQVIEQSLDIDFDEMVTDLAPIDLLLQRAGRLRRHHRDGEGNRIAGEDQRGPTCLHVLSPDPDAVTDGDWYARLLPHAAPVYPDHGQLWLTSRLLKDRGHIHMPGELRDFIEGVFGEDAGARVPAELEARSDRAAGQRRADTALARFNTIKVNDGYRHVGGEWWDESHTPTRLGEITTTVRLARWDGETLAPCFPDPRHPWAMSEVKVRQAQLSTEAPVADSRLAGAIKDLRASWGDRGQQPLLVALVHQDDQWRGRGSDARGRAVTITYSTRSGLLITTDTEAREAT